MNFIKRRSLALAGAIVFFLTGCSVKGSTPKEIEANSSSQIDSYVEEVLNPITEETNTLSLVDENTVSGDKLKIFAFYMPELGTYQYSVLKETDSKMSKDEDQPWKDVVDKTFIRVIPDEDLSTMYNSCQIETAYYESISDDDLSGSITKVKVSNDEFDGYGQIVDVSGTLAEKFYLSKCTSISVNKNGENINESARNIVVLGENSYVEELNSREEIDVVPACYISLNADKVYSISQLEHLQNGLNNITIGTKKVVDNVKQLQL